MNNSFYSRYLALLLVFLCLTSVYPLRADVIYVDANATGANNGSSWADVYKCLQDALTAEGSFPIPNSAILTLVSSALYAHNPACNNKNG